MKIKDFLNEAGPVADKYATWLEAVKSTIFTRQAVYIHPKTNHYTDEKKTGYILLDATTAKMLNKIIVALGSHPDIKKKFLELPITKAVDAGWKMVK